MLTLLAVLAAAPQWPAAEGWRVGERTIEATGMSSDRRLVSSVPAPAEFKWRVKLDLRGGRSAGVLFGLTANGNDGYKALLDNRLGQLILSRIGPWPKEERLAAFRWEPVDGNKLTLRIEAGAGACRVFVEERGAYPLLEARNYTPPGNRIGLYAYDARATYSPENPAEIKAPLVQAHTPEVGEFVHFYDQTVGESRPWYINDHCLIDGPGGWHLYGITDVQPANPMNERHFAHATAKNLTDRPWQKQPYALDYKPDLGENHLWAPHVIKRGDTFYMFYCAGSRQSNYHFRIHLATSKDLVTWTRYPSNPIFQDFYDARDPMVLEDEGTYYLYYTANLDYPRGNHIVSVRTSKNLVDWSTARTAFVHPEQGTFGGPTESPFVVKYGGHFYLFCGPDGSYRTTKVYRSPNPYGWRHEDQIYSFPSHAAEVVQDRDGRYYATNCGWDLNGVFLAPLEWKLAP